MRNLILHHINVDPDTRASTSDVLQYMHRMTEGQSIPAPAVQPKPEIQQQKPSQKPPAELKPTSKQPKHLDPNTLAARRLAQRQGGRRRSHTETDADTHRKSTSQKPHP